MVYAFMATINIDNVIFYMLYLRHIYRIRLRYKNLDHVQYDLGSKTNDDFITFPSFIFFN